MPTSTRRRGKRARKLPTNDQKHVAYRSGVLQLNEHRQDPLPVEFLMQFAIEMIRTSSSDKTMLCIAWAADKTGVKKEQAQEFFLKALKDQQKNSMWPKGFMP
jgi:hypothetical protein